MTIKTFNEEETILLGSKVGRLFLNMHGVILLEGDLAAGKTTFTKGIAKALEIKDIIKSPTFTIMKEYDGLKKLYHLDLYRLSDIGNDFDLEEYVSDENSLVVIEWPNQVRELLPDEYLLIEISGNLNERTFKLTAVGKKYQEVLNKI